jgi:tetratricopeptide (TPR) repeat protein
MRLVPTSAVAQHAHAGILRHRGQFKEALDAYITAYELDQTNDRAAAIVGNTVSALGRPDLALRWYEKAVHRQPRPGIYSEYIGDSWSDLGEDARAESEFRTAITFRPDLSGATVGLAKLALLNHQFDKARQQTQQAQHQFPGDWDVQLLVAQIEFFDHRFDNAEWLYRDLLTKKHDGELSFSSAIRFLSALGLIRRQVGDESGGRILLEEARDLDLKDLQAAPDNPTFLYSLAADYSALGQKEEAVSQLQKAVRAGWIDYRFLSLDPRFDSIREIQQFKEIFLQLTAKVRAMDANTAGRLAAVN